MLEEKSLWLLEEDSPSLRCCSTRVAIPQVRPLDEVDGDEKPVTAAAAAGVRHRPPIENCSQRVALLLSEFFFLLLS